MRPTGPSGPSGDVDGRSGPYERAALHLIDLVSATWPGLDRRSIALGVPLWLARRLGDEIEEATSTRSGGLEILDLRGTPVVGTPLLQRGPLGTFLAQDLIGGGTYPLPWRCHPDVEPDAWPVLTLAVRMGLNPAAALGLAELSG